MERKSEIIFQERAAESKKHKILQVLDLRIPENNTEARLEQSPHPVLNERLDGFYYFPNAVTNLIEAIEKRYVEVSFDGKDNLVIKLLPLSAQILPKELGHITEVEQFKQGIQHEIFGKLTKDDWTYLQTTDFGVEGSYDYLSSIVDRQRHYLRFYVDVDRLLKKRDIYLDPECLNVVEEDFGRAFAIKGGIPRDAIVRAELMFVPPRPESTFFNRSPVDIPTAEEVLENERKQRDRLSEYLKSKNL